MATDKVERSNAGRFVQHLITGGSMRPLFVYVPLAATLLAVVSAGALASDAKAAAVPGKKSGPLSALPFALGPYVEAGEQCRAPSTVTWFEPNGFWDISAEDRFFSEIASVSREGAEYVLEFPVDPSASGEPEEGDVTGVLVRPAGLGRIVMTIQDFVSLKLCQAADIPARLRP